MITLTVAVLILAAIYFYVTRNFDYWEKRGVKYDKSSLAFKTYLKSLLNKNVANLAAEAYKNFPNEQLVGTFEGTQPELLIRDPELAKLVMVTEFSSFHRRRLAGEGPLEPLRKHVGFADDDLWRQLRQRTTPAFTSSKIKAMFPIIVKRAETLQTRLREIAAAGKAVDAKDLMSRFLIDVIGSVAFGVACDAINNDDDAMLQLSIKIHSINFYLSLLKETLKEWMPKVFGHLKVLASVEREVFEMVHTVMKQRNYEPSGRHDVIDMLLESKKQGAMVGDSIVEVNPDGTPKRISIEMDDTILVAQSFMFFDDGFGTSATVTTNTLYEIAHNALIQEKVQGEIDSVLARHDNKLSYDAISEMTYLRWCVNESLRVFPIAIIIKRQCVKEYIFPGLNVTVDPGMFVTIPVEAYQKDPEIFPDPQEFRPERFDPEKMTSQQKLAYLPFGDGPHTCFGKRLGLMQSMAGLAAVLSQFSVKPAPGAPRHPVVTALSNLPARIMGTLPVIFQERKRL